jgi:hypothetical protein
MKKNFTYLRLFGISLVLSLAVGCVKLQKSGSETQTAPAPAAPQSEPMAPTVTPPASQSATQAPPAVPGQVLVAPAEPPPPEPPPETRLVIEGDVVLDVKKVMQLGALFKKDGANEVYTIRVDNLIFKDHAVLKTEGLNLEIESKRLIVDGRAQLVTFATGDKADLDKSGRSGGHIVIRTQIAEGQLDFFLNGENGGDGLTGAVPGPEKNGANGANGSDGLVDLLQSWIWGTEGGGSIWWIPECKTHPTRGAMGASGHQGNQGMNGKPGGNTAELIFRVLDKQNFSFYIIEQNPGLGGQGGAGGAGGQPGTQGNDGIVLTSEAYKKSHWPTASPLTDAFCSTLAVVQTRPTVGPQGPPGNTGPTGEIKKNSL